MAWLSCTNSCKKVFISVCNLSARFQDFTFGVADIEMVKTQCFEGKHKDFKLQHHDAWHCNQETILDTHFQWDFYFFKNFFIIWFSQEEMKDVSHREHVMASGGNVFCMICNC